MEKLDYPLTIVAYETENELNFRIKYAAELFTDSTIDMLFHLMHYLIEQIIDESEQFNYVKKYRHLVLLSIHRKQS
ncbi:hypothetical protein HV444_03550 [Enterococcus faecium]|nr:hypothetical protein [Enterococcus faecium]